MIGNLPGQSMAIQHVIESKGCLAQTAQILLETSGKLGLHCHSVGRSQRASAWPQMAPDLRRLPCFSQASLRLELVDDMIVRHHLTGNSKCEARIPRG